MKVHSFNMQAGKTYTILLNTNAFPAHLRVQNAAGIVLGNKDGKANVSLTIQAPGPGPVIAVVSSHDAKVGQYNITITEQ